MKKIYFLLIFLFIVQFSVTAQSIFELSPSQSMSITGKGQGQDAAMNPYSGGNSIGIVENKGENSFVIRIQYSGEVIKMITINPKEIREISLLKGFELYLDSDLPSKAKVKFRKSSK